MRRLLACFLWTLLAVGCPRFSASREPIPPNDLDASTTQDAPPIFDAVRLDTRTSDGSSQRDGAREANLLEGGVAPRTNVDLLLVLDNSSSMEQKQTRVRTELPRFLQMLTSGDLSGGTELDRDFRHVDSLHIGVVVTDMGVGHAMIGASTACAVSQHQGAEVARNGALVARVFSFPEDAAQDFVRDATTVGTQGCGIERPFDALLRALSPTQAGPDNAADYQPPQFAGDNGASLQGLGSTGANQNFLRPDSILVALVVSDEDDSSLQADINATEYFSYPAGSTGVHPGVRGPIDGYHELRLRPVAEIARSLVGLRVHPAHVVFGALVGLPSSATTTQPVQLLRVADLRPRIFTRGAMCPSAAADDCGPCPNSLESACATRSQLTELTPVCMLANASPADTSALAAPGYRAVGVARQVELLGASSVVGSICGSDYRDFFTRLAEAVSRLTS